MTEALTDAGALANRIAGVLEEVGKSTDRLVQVDTYMRQPVFSVLVGDKPRFDKYALPKADRPVLRKWIFQELTRLQSSPEHFFAKLRSNEFVIDYALKALEHDALHSETVAISKVLSSLTIPSSKPWKPLHFGRLQAAMFPLSDQPKEVASLMRTATVTALPNGAAASERVASQPAAAACTKPETKLQVQRRIWNRSSKCIESNRQVEASVQMLGFRILLWLMFDLLSF